MFPKASVYGSPVTGLIVAWELTFWQTVPVASAYEPDGHGEQTPFA